MKKLASLLLLLFAFVSSFCQEFSYSFKDSSLWHQNSRITIPNQGEIRNEHQRYIVLTDSISNDTLFQKLMAPNSDWEIHQPAIAHFKCYKNEIYFKYPNGTWKLKYNYNLLVGDSFTFQLENYPPYVEKKEVTLKVTSVDSVLIGSSKRKKITFEKFNADIRPVWVEGIGDNNLGIVLDYGYFINYKRLGGGSYILCYNSGLEKIIGDCDINKTTSIQSIETFDPVVFPNPFSTKINIHSYSNIDRVALFTSNGLRVKSGNVNEIEQTDFSELPSGIYYLELWSGNYKLSRFKLIKK